MEEAGKGWESRGACACSAGAGVYYTCAAPASAFWGRRGAAWVGWMAGHGRRAEHWVHWMRVGGQGRAGQGRPVVQSRLRMLLPYIATLLRHGRCCGGGAAPGWAVCWWGGARAAGRVVQAGGEDCAPTCKQSREAGCVSAHLSCVYSVITIIVLRELPLGCASECSFVACIVAASLVLCVCAMCVVPRRACSAMHASCLASTTHTPAGVCCLSLVRVYRSHVMAGVFLLPAWRSAA